MAETSGVPITYQFPEEKIKAFKEAEKQHEAMNYPIVLGGKYLCDIDWILYEMYASTFHKSPAEDIGKFLKEKGYVKRLVAGEIKKKTLVYEIDAYLSNIHCKSGKEPDMDYAEKLHAYRLSAEFHEWEQKVKNGPRWELL